MPDCDLRAGTPGLWRTKAKLHKTDMNNYLSRAVAALMRLGGLVDMPNAQKLFQKAEKLLQKQKFDSALGIYLKLFQAQPQNDTVLLNLAELSFRLGRREDSLGYNRLLADLYIERNDVSKAVVTCRKILKAAPEDVATLARLAGLLKKTHKAAEAIEAFREATELHRRNGETAEALECLQQAIELEPGNFEDHVELARLAIDSGKTALAAETLLKAAAIARRNKMEDRWVELVERSHQLDPSNEAGRIATAEVCLANGRAREGITLLEPISQARPEDEAVLELLCRAYLSAGEFRKAEPVCLKLYQAHPETIVLAEQLVGKLLKAGETARALLLVEGIKEEMCCGQENKEEFLALVEQIYRFDENNLDVLELLPPLYNELNREGDLRRSLTRMFNLYLASEQYDKAADTLEGILDVDPYGAGHSDRLLNLEGHIDEAWYSNIADRISVPGAGDGFGQGSLTQAEAETAPGEPAALEDLIVEGEMYQRYHLTEKLEATIKRINRLYPDAHESNESLRDLYEVADFHPPPSIKATGDEEAATPASLEELGKISAITDIIHRQGTPERVLRAAVDQIGYFTDASRCWVALGSPDAAAPLKAEYVSPDVAPSDPDAAFKIWSFLIHHAAEPGGWSFEDASGEVSMAPIAPELQILGIHSLLGVPLTEKEEVAGLLLVEQCHKTRRWTAREKVLLRTTASQVMIAINHAKLRRLVRSLAPTDSATDLLPRSAYLDCLLAEARRAEEQSRSLAVCLMEPTDAARLSHDLGEARMRSYLEEVGRAVSSHVRQNDIAIRYGPCTIALCLPDTLLAQSRVVVEKLQSLIHRTRFVADVSTDFCATVGDLFHGPGFDAVDAVTEIVNRLETSMETLRKQPGTAILMTRFEG